MRRNVLETVMGAVVLLVAAVFVSFAYEMTQARSTPGYTLNATFGKVGGLAVGSDVRISGIKVGTVSDRRLDPHTYDAVVTVKIDEQIKLPEDTVAAIASEGPLGGRYLRLLPGTSTQTIPPGGSIKETRGFRSLEDQVGEIIFLATGKSEQPK
ncbi:MAG: MCE family protein [Rhodospirillales bacterium]|nr:MCE family protein [Rhodospirillales bacterium]